MIACCCGKIIRILPTGWILKKWQIVGVFVVLFIGSYVNIIYQHRFGGGILTKEVFFLLLFSAIFVFMILTLSADDT
jgi:hypothetical protein